MVAEVKDMEARHNIKRWRVLSLVILMKSRHATALTATVRLHRPSIRLFSSAAPSDDVARLSKPKEADDPHSIPLADDGDDELVSPTLTRSTFPPTAYYLARDEDQIKHTFISFIDHTFGSSYDQVTRLVEPRYYARPNQFQKEARYTMPTVDDIAPPQSLYGPLGAFLAWNRLPARLIVGTLAYFFFPPFIEWLAGFVASQNIDIKSLEELVGTFLPSVSIVLGTYFSLTLSILYGRFSRMQETISLEASLLALTFTYLMDVFRDDTAAMVQGAQCIADQIGTLVRESRGRETMRLIYNDPYARILDLVRNHQANLNAPLVDKIRNNVAELFRVRARRMSDEALALAPTHFDVLTFLSGLLLLGFSLGAVASTETTGVPSGLSRLLFAALVVCYVILYEMGYDLNRPFHGVYQIRRDAAAMHFLQVKHSICQHPELRDVVGFEQADDEEEKMKFECEADCAHRKSKIWYN